MRSEARKVHDLFFDLLGVAFSDTDFRDARNALSFTAPIPAPAAGPSSRQNQPAGQSRRQKSVKDVDSDSGPYQKPQTRGPIHNVESSKARSLVPPRGGRELSQQEDARPFTHPLDLVICKKKRKDREKSGAKAGGPLSPTGMGRGIKSPGSISGGKEGGTGQHSWGALSPQQGNNSGGSVGWANPVKRLRTDARRRPSHL